MANEYVSQIQLPNNEIYDIKDKNAVKDITSSDIPGNINFTKGEETKDVLVKDFGLAYGVDLYKDQLPIEVTSPGGNAADWTIYGNDNVGENLFDIGTSTSDYDHNNVITEIDSHSLSMNIVGAGGTWTYRSKKISTTGEHTISLSSDKTYPRIMFALRNQEDTGWLTNSDISIPGYVYNAVYHGWFNEISTTIGSATASFSIPNCLYWQLGFGYNSNAANIGTVGTLSNIMLVKGSTAPDHYIPYQQGVGERTANLFDKDTVTFGTNEGQSSQKIPVTVGEKYFVTRTSELYALARYYKSDDTSSASSGWISASTSIKIPADTVYVRMFFRNSTYGTLTEAEKATIGEAMFTAGSTAPAKYIPYGYKVPLTVSQQGQPDKTVDIYIGDSPLTEGETVSKTSTGVDIELFEGENTVSTTLYNKPIMEIKPTNSTYNLIEQVKTNKEDILSLHLNITDNTSTTNTTTALTNGNVYLRFKGNKNNDLHKISGTGGTTVTTDTNANILINSPFVSLSNGTITINNNTITPLTSHQSVTDNNPTLSWGTKSKVATIGSTEINVTMPSNPNTDRYVNSASFAHDSTNNNVKMTLTRAGSDTNTVTANIPKVSSSTAGVVPKGATVSSQSQSTKFLREDGSWAAPSYTTNTTYTLSTGDSNGQIKVTPSSGNAYNVDVKGLGSNAYSSTAYLPLTGGTVTGVINIKSSNLDRDGEAPTDDQTGKSLYFVDKDDDGVGRIYTVQRKTNNKKDLFISVYNASGTTNSIGIRILDDGTQSYYLSNPSAFRDTLDNAAYIGTNTITSNQVIIADGTDGKLKSSGYTINKSVPSNAVFTDEKVKTNLIAPEGDEFPIYYLTATGNTTESAKQLFMNDNVKIRIQTGTASAFGRARIMLGNSIEEGTAGNCCGQLQLYSTDSGFSVLRQATGVSSSGITIYLPPKSGTIFNTGNLAAGDNITLTESNGVYSINGTANTDTKVSQTATTTSANYEILFSATADNTTRTEGARKTSGLKYNPDSDRLWIGRSGTSSGSIALYGTINGVSSYGVLKQDYNPNGSNVTHTFPTVGGYVFNSGNVSAGAGITISASGDRYTIKSKNKIYLYKTHTSLFSDINDDAFRSCKYFKIYYKDSNNCNYNCITMNMDTNIFPEGSSGTTSYTNGKVFTLSCIGDVNKTYLRTATFHFATKGGGGIWKLVFNSSFLWDPSQATGSSLTWTSTKQTSYSNSYIKIIKLEYFWEDA